MGPIVTGEGVVVPFFEGFDLFSQWVQMQNAARIAQTLNRSLCLPPLVTVNHLHSTTSQSVPFTHLFHMGALSKVRVHTPSPPTNLWVSTMLGFSFIPS